MKEKIFLETLKTEFRSKVQPENAIQQKAYMRLQFEFLGIKTPERRALLKPFLKKDQLPHKDELQGIVKDLWQQPEREFQYAAQELAFCYLDKLQEIDLDLYEYMTTQHSWWDSVDFIADKLMGAYFRKYPEKTWEKVREWLTSENLWLQRCAILFQLKYKQKTDTRLLLFVIGKLETSREFFIKKAIGWALREYAKTNPEWVRHLCAQQTLSALSYREAMKHLGYKGQGAKDLRQ